MKVVERSEIEEQYKWKLEDIVESDAEWDKIYQKLVNEKNDVLKYSGKLSQPKEILACFKQQDEQALMLTKLYVYAKMRLDQDVAQSK
ncbi:MAG: oligoendopeptidase F, partial [Clostridia bacterium]